MKQQGPFSWIGCSKVKTLLYLNFMGVKSLKSRSNVASVIVMVIKICSLTEMMHLYALIDIILCANWMQDLETVCGASYRVNCVLQHTHILHYFLQRVWEFLNQSPKLWAPAFARWAVFHYWGIPNTMQIV